MTVKDVVKSRLYNMVCIVFAIKGCDNVQIILNSAHLNDPRLVDWTNSEKHSYGLQRVIDELPSPLEIF